MRPRIIVILLACSVAACGSDKGSSQGKGAEPGGGAGTAGASPGGASNAGASGSGATMTGPPITTAPATWTRPADCSGVGDTCPGGIFDCTGKSVCQTEGYVCIPPGADSGLKLQPPSAERPYCLAYQCMTYDEASCFCTGKAAAQFPTCSSPSAVAGLCQGAGASCTAHPCCDGLTCIKQSGTVSTCQKTCSQGSDCDTGCCTDPHETGQTICSPMTACQNPCTKRGGACTAGTTNTCCTGACITSTNTDFSGCRALCNTDADCDTGCCQPFTSASGGFCADAKYCMCGDLGAACGPMMAKCCDGNTCASLNSGPYTCYKQCMTTSDCAGAGCCIQITGQTYGACNPGGC